MTEEQILNAPESDYMNDQQRAFFKQRLMTLKAQIESDIEKGRADLQASEHHFDATDRAAFEENLSVSGRILSRESNLMERIDQALELIESGKYGYCEETNEPIGISRLLARPTARLCIAAKMKKESESKLYRDARASEEEK